MPTGDKALAAFGRNVAKFRTERGLSQDKLAEEASLDRTYVSGIERGVRNPGIKVVIRLARDRQANRHHRQFYSQREVGRYSQVSQTVKTFRRPGVVP